MTSEDATAAAHPTSVTSVFVTDASHFEALKQAKLVPTSSKLRLMRLRRFETGLKQVPSQIGDGTDGTVLF